MSATGLSNATRDALANAIKTAIDAGAGAGKLRIYKGTQPAPNGEPAGGAADLLAELTFTDPCGAVSAGSGTLTFSAITADASANNAGTATWARLEDSDGNNVLDIDVTATGGGGSLTLNTVTIGIGDPVAVTSLLLYVNPTFSQ